MKHFPVLAFCWVLPALSVAQTGSGTVEFEFTGFSGPIASSLASNSSAWGDDSTWRLTGLVNQQFPVADGWTSAGPPIPPAQASGYITGTLPLGGTNAVSFRYTTVAEGSAAENLVDFQPRPFTNVGLGENFVLGTLTFQNGSWFGGGTSATFNTPTNLQFRITTKSESGVAFNQTITGDIRVVVHAPTPSDFQNLAGQQAEADWVYLVSPAVTATMGSFRVFDEYAKPPGFSNRGTVDIVAQFNSLDIVSFANPQGGFVIGSVQPIPGVPEPGTWALVLGGFAAIWGRVNRFRK